MFMYVTFYLQKVDNVFLFAVVLQGFLLKETYLRKNAGLI